MDVKAYNDSEAAGGPQITLGKPDFIHALTYAAVDPACCAFVVMGFRDRFGPCSEIYYCSVPHNG